METLKYDWDRLLSMGYSEETVDSLKKACWKGYEAIGLKNKGGRKVPDCVKTDKVNHTENPMDLMAIAPDLEKEPAKPKPLMGQSKKRTKSKAIIQ
jgi:hypothetical protein